MNWLLDLDQTNATAQAIAIIALVCMAGMVLGSLKVRGIGLGTAGVLFASLIVGAITEPIDHNTLKFVKEFGLMLFVFCIGLQLGPGFFASLRKTGLRLNTLAATVVVLGAVLATGLGWLLEIDFAAVLGMFSGATTNTPSLGAAQQTLSALPGVSAERAALPALSYAVSYPLAIVGLLLRDLKMPDFRDYAVEVPSPGVMTAESTRVMGKFLRDVMKQNLQGDNFRLFSPDENNSNRWQDVPEVTNRCYMAEIYPEDDKLSPDGRVMEVPAALSRGRRDRHLRQELV